MPREVEFRVQTENILGYACEHRLIILPYSNVFLDFYTDETEDLLDKTRNHSVASELW